MDYPHANIRNEGPFIEMNLSIIQYEVRSALRPRAGPHEQSTDGVAPQSRGNASLKSPTPRMVLISPLRTVSADNASSVSILRPLLFRSNTLIQNSNRHSYADPVTSRTDENRERRPSSTRQGRAGDRSSGIFSSIFKFPQAQPRTDGSMERRPSSSRPAKAGDRSPGVFTSLRETAPAVSRTDRSMDRRPSSARPGRAGDRSSGVFGAFMGPAKPAKKPEIVRPEPTNKPEPVRKAEPPKKQMAERRYV